MSENQLHLSTFKFFSLPYNKHLINWPKSVCMGAQSCVQSLLRSVYTHNLGQESPIQTLCLVNNS